MVIHRHLVALVVIGCVTACSDAVLVIESDTNWAGFIEGHGRIKTPSGGRSSGTGFAGDGDSRIQLDNGARCWDFATISPGRLKVYAIKKSLLGSDRVGEDEVTHPGGEVEGCL